MKDTVFLAVVLALLFPMFSYAASSPVYPLKVSTNGRYLVDQSNDHGEDDELEIRREW